MKESAMQAQMHTLNNLFAQLGLPADEAGLEHFIATHRPLANDIPLIGRPSGARRSGPFSRRKSSRMPTGRRSSTN
jgi:hypothetical protein